MTANGPHTATVEALTAEVRVCATGSASWRCPTPLTPPRNHERTHAAHNAKTPAAGGFTRPNPKRRS